MASNDGTSLSLKKHGFEFPLCRLFSFFLPAPRTVRADAWQG
jgi:hypothetical protein